MWSAAKSSISSQSSEEVLAVEETDNEETTLTTSRTDLEESEMDAELDKCARNEQKLIRGIMMSSHNVSSLHEIENRFMNRRNR